MSDEERNPLPLVIAVIAVVVAIGGYLFAGRSLTSQQIEENEKSSNKSEKKPTYNEHPKSIAELGYKFQDRKLVDIETGGKFKFIDQKHYELLGDLIVDEIQNIMKEEQKMVEVLVPDSEKEKKRANIFHSPDFFKNKDALMVLICGSGAVRAGQWARSLCINDSLNNGTVIPYLEDAHAAGYATIVLNPNFTSETLSSPEKHTLYVWDNFIAKSPAKKIVIVAHSYGGVVTMNLLFNRAEQVYERVKGIAFTDSVHSVKSETKKKGSAFLAARARNWVKSKKPLDTEIQELSSIQGCKLVSAGHDTHEYTSGVARPSVFAFLKEMLEEND
eukprot:Phypoly_transcript_10285.p1 GENE.Phypoly_transcript_10285~~Phypoly_transcript_10285.p1  ORF type:complete len:331 (+),score=73.34 Phypoly_transcript_10285:209-1201(+)